MDVFHEGFDGLLWDFKVGKFVNGMFVYCSSDSGCNGDEWVCFPFIILYGIHKGIIFRVFVGDNLVREFVVAVCDTGYHTYTCT